MNNTKKALTTTSSLVVGIHEYYYSKLQTNVFGGNDDGRWINIKYPTVAVKKYSAVGVPCVVLFVIFGQFQLSFQKSPHFVSKNEKSPCGEYAFPPP